MTQFILSSGFIELRDEHHDLVSDRQPCEFEWSVGQGTFDFRLCSRHYLTSQGEACFIAVTEEKGKLLFSHALERRLAPGAELIVKPWNG